jgi:hypothetical protein
MFSIYSMTYIHGLNWEQKICTLHILISVVNFPTRIQHNSATATDNIFIDITMAGYYSITPIINWLSDHDAQIITFYSLRFRPLIKNSILIWKINELTINNFLLKLSYETWDNVFSTDSVNEMFSFFLDSYLKLFYSSFPPKRVFITKKNKKNNDNWITLWILTSSKRKRELFIACRCSNNLHLKNYCKILYAVIKEAKNLIMLTKLINPWIKIKLFGT